MGTQQHPAVQRRVLWCIEAARTLVLQTTASGGPDIDGQRGGSEMPRSGEQSNNEEVTFLGDIPVEVVIELGRRRMVLKEVAALDVDDIVELDQPMDRPLDLVVGGRVLARGELVMVGERVALRVTELVGRPREEG
jgi:flagellar motor switch protein FliN/FliY